MVFSRLLSRLTLMAALPFLVMCGEAGTGGPGEDVQRILIGGESGGAAADFHALDHDGGASDLALRWTEDSRFVRMCPGTHTLNFQVRNHSQHTPGRNLWFTILYYRGYEYVNGHEITPMNIDVPVGATQDVEYTIDIEPEFASAGNRDILIALIVQTDNPNMDDPDAFFQRLWLRIVPGDDCPEPAMSQPDREILHIHSVTCQNRRVFFQVGTSLIPATDDPHVEIVGGHQYIDLVRGAFLDDFGGRDFWWAEIFVTNQIPRGDFASVFFGSRPENSMIFHLSPRVECGGGGFVHFNGVNGTLPPDSPPPPPRPGEPDPDVPEPDVPEPDVPDPDVPEPDVPEPDVPEPDVPEPDVPEPDVPEPDVPEPDVPEPDVPDDDKKNETPFD